MTVYQGPSLGDIISLAAPEPQAVASALRAVDLPDHEKEWFERAQRDESCFFFAVQRGDRLIGQIVLHDIDWTDEEALVAYHLFRAEDRGRGYGTAALEAICNYAFRSLGLRRLVVITSGDNLPSRRIAEKAGFRLLGTAREGEHLLAYERLTKEVT